MTVHFRSTSGKISDEKFTHEIAVEIQGQLKLMIWVAWRSLNEMSHLEWQKIAKIERNC